MIRLAPDVTGQARYASRLQTLVTRARRFRWVGRSTLAVFLGLAGYSVAQDWNTPNRCRTRTSQTAGVGLAMLGGYAGYATCAVGLGLPTGGQSSWICALLVGGAAGAVLGEAGAAGAEALYDTATRAATRNERDTAEDLAPAFTLERSSPDGHRANASRGPSVESEGCLCRSFPCLRRRSPHKPPRPRTG